MDFQTIQRTIFASDRRIDSLYQRTTTTPCRGGAKVEILDRHSARIRCGGLISSDTLFNSFFEAYWRAYTSVRDLELRVHSSGRASIRLFRRLSNRQVQELGRAEMAGEDKEVVISVPFPPN